MLNNDVADEFFNVFFAQWTFYDKMKLLAVILSLQFGTYWYYIHDNHSILMLKLKCPAYIVHVHAIDKLKITSSSAIEKRPCCRVG